MDRAEEGDRPQGLLKRKAPEEVRKRGFSLGGAEKGGAGRAMDVNRARKRVGPSPGAEGGGDRSAERVGWPQPSQGNECGKNIYKKWYLEHVGESGKMTEVWLWLQGRGEVKAFRKPGIVRGNAAATPHRVSCEPGGREVIWRGRSCGNRG